MKPRSQPPTGTAQPRAAAAARRLARRVLRRQCALLAQLRRAALRAPAPESVHDLRVALRRLRTALRFFRRALPDSAPSLRRRLGTLADRLGPLRDREVWDAFLETPEVAAALGAAADAQRRREAARQRRHETLRRLLAGAAWRRALRDLAALCQTPPPAPAHGKAASLEKFVSRSLRRACRAARCPALPPPADTAAIHAFRKRVRRARYSAEFASPILGRRAERLAQCLKALADALGDVHDLDVQRVRLRSARRPPPRALLALIRRRRQAAWRSCRTAFRALQKRKFHPYWSA